MVLSLARTLTVGYAWDLAAAVPLMLTDGSTSFIYADNGLPVEQIAADGTVYYYHHGQLGSTRLLSTSSGSVAATFSYSPTGTSPPRPGR
ncbi:MAG: hypothetical protein M0T77_08845 [Actinomycetota bacterium]|nr:hypothetical protein [Actinomycetota bacterium]